MRFLLALILGKLIQTIIRTFGAGGTALPGLFAISIDSLFIAHSLETVPQVIAVAGTNGKTTTTRIIGKILKMSNRSFISNRAGSNLLRGIASAVLDQYQFGKSLPSTALIEVDETTLPLILSHVRPTVVVLLNLFRDQLDRYGEVDTIRSQWQEALKHHPECTLVLNADDPAIAHIGHQHSGRILWFGIEDRSHATKESTSADVRLCLVCASPLSYRGYLVSHLGWYECKKCGRSRPSPHVSATRIESHNLVDMSLQIRTPTGVLHVILPLPGLYNGYNALAAVAAGIALQIDLGVIADGLAAVTAAFGRAETVTIGTKRLVFFLMKNPAGLSALSRVIVHTPIRYHTLIALNDNLADGTDVSWIWDAPFEHIVPSLSTVTLTGSRVYDLALRLKYANTTIPLRIIPSTTRALEHALYALPDNKSLLVIPTYTALLEIRSSLSKKTKAIKHLKEAVV